MIFFSAIIPTYNSESTIGLAVESVLSQTFGEYEVLIIDGRSTDSTVAIVHQYSQQDKRVRYLSEKDKGIYDAMNKGISMAKGKWLFFLGSDDSLYDNEVFSFVHIAIMHNPATKFVYGDIRRLDGMLITYNTHTYEDLMRANIGHQSIFYDRSLFAVEAYNLRYKILADWDFNLKVFNSSNKPLYVNKIISNYNIYGASADLGKQQEYIAHFSNLLKLALRYRSIAYFVVWTARRLSRKIKSKLLSAKDSYRV